jgi:hypothetical protein
MNADQSWPLWIEKLRKYRRATICKMAHFMTTCFINYLKINYLKKQQKKQRIS